MKKFNNSKVAKATMVALAFAGLSFFGCKKQKVVNENALKITATFYPLYIMAMNITENVPDVSLAMLAPSDTGCLHDYTLTTKDMSAIEDCDILIANGAGMELFFDDAEKITNGAVINASEGFELVDDNPHIWVSPKGARYQVKKIAEGLAKFDSAHADLYKKNAEAYDKKLTTLSEKMHSALDEFAGKNIITFHEAFPYFASEFNFKIASVVEREPGEAPSAEELHELIEMIKDVQAKGKSITLYAEPQYPSSAAKVIANETGLKVFMLDPAVTGELKKDAYLDAQNANIKTLVSSFAK